MVHNTITMGNNMGRRGRPRLDGSPKLVHPPKSPSRRSDGFIAPDEPTLARTLAMQHVELAIDVLVEIASSPTNVMARVRAATELLDRACGKPHLMLEQKELPPATQVQISFGDNFAPAVSLPQIDAVVDETPTVDDPDTD